MKHTKILIALIALLITSVSVSASLLTQFSDDFEDGDYTSNPVWNVSAGTWDVALLDTYVLRPTTGAYTNGMKISNLSREWFGQYAFKVTYDLSMYNKTNIAQQDVFSVNIGENTTSLGRYVFNGYHLTMGIGGTSETLNQCLIYLAKRNNSVETQLYYNYSWFNNTNIPCQPGPIHVEWLRDITGMMSLKINNLSVYNRSQTDEESNRWNVITLFSGLGHITGHMKVWVDNIKVYNASTEVIHCVEDWLVQYNNASCNGTFINEIKTYIDNNTCGTYSDLPGDNNTISNTYDCATPPTGNVAADIDQVNNNYLTLGITLFLAIWVIVALFGGNIKEAKPLIIAIIVLILIIGGIMYFLDLWGRTFQ